MRKNKRHSAKELESYINLYLKNGISHRELKENDRLKLNRNNFNKYVSKYRVYCRKVLISKASNNTYSSEFKNKIIEEYLTGKIPYRKLAIKYKIPTHTTVTDGVLKYTNGKENRSYSPKSEVYLMKTRRTTSEERIQIVEDYLNNHLTY